MGHLFIYFFEPSKIFLNDIIIFDKRSVKLKIFIKKNRNVHFAQKHVLPWQMLENCFHVYKIFKMNKISTNKYHKGNILYNNILILMWLNRWHGVYLSSSRQQDR